MQKRIHNSRGVLRHSRFSGQAKNIGIVMQAGGDGGLFVRDQGGPHALDLVRADAHAHTGSTNEARPKSALRKATFWATAWA